MINFLNSSAKCVIAATQVNSLLVPLDIVNLQVFDKIFVFLVWEAICIILSKNNFFIYNNDM